MIGRPRPPPPAARRGSAAPADTALSSPAPVDPGDGSAPVVAAYGSEDSLAAPEGVAQAAAESEVIDESSTLYNPEVDELEEYKKQIEKEEKRIRMRRLAVDEIISTERDYVADLMLIKRVRDFIYCDYDYDYPLVFFFFFFFFFFLKKIMGWFN